MESKAHRESFHQTTSLSPFSTKLLLKLFPFGLLIDTKINVIGMGKKYSQIWVGKEPVYDRPLSNFFRMRRPKGIAATWKNVSVIE